MSYASLAAVGNTQCSMVHVEPRVTVDGRLHTARGALFIVVAAADRVRLEAYPRWARAYAGSLSRVLLRLRIVPVLRGTTP